MRIAGLFLLFALILSTPLAAAGIAEKTAGMQKLDGFIPMYWDTKTGSLFLEINRWDAEFLFYTSLPAGLGSNDVGLDRGQLGQERVLRFHRVGPKVLLMEGNQRYRALSNDAPERRAVAEAFAESVHWGFTVAAESADAVLIDATAFFLRDAHGAADRLRESKQGTYKVDATRSAIYMDRTRGFPRNTEVEALLTLTGEPQGRFVTEVAPEPGAITLREHFSFVELPSGYTPRKFDPRGGFIPLIFSDYAAPLGEPVVQRYIIRHRLEKRDPAAAASEAVKPIVYYLDPGTPEPVRSALLEGARWWDQAFEAAGFRNAWKVELLPPDADPMDVRYNMINWVHRSTRGWSYGASIVDPRTGEILKGNVTLGSLRVRQDYLIAEALLAPYESGKPVPSAMREMALQRLRQLAAHEVGHTLGLTHNFAANRVSVMDYPHPLFHLGADGQPTAEGAYTSGIGEWDKAAIDFGYRQFARGADQAAALDRILRAAEAKGLRFITDTDARSESGSSPVGNLWDNGTNAVDELQRVMTLRRTVLARFSERNIRPGQPMSALESTLVPAYLIHRYQVEAAAKIVGGVDFNYALRGDGQMVTKVVAGAEQRRALAAILATLRPEELELSEKLLRLLPPRAFGYGPSREDFKGRTGLNFDALAPAEAAAHLTLALLLNPERAARMEQLHARDAGVPGFAEVLEQMVNHLWRLKPATGMRAEIQYAVGMTALDHLMVLAMNESTPASVRRAATAALQQAGLLGPYAKLRVDRFLRDGKAPALPRFIEPPPGAPIGDDATPPELTAAGDR